MPISPNELNKIDYEILSYISKFESIHVSKISKKFRKLDGIEFRLSSLAKFDRSPNPPYIPISDTSYLHQEYKRVEHEDSGITHEPTGVFSVSDLGKRALQNYKADIYLAKRDFWKRSFLAPLLVALIISLITTLVTLFANGVLWFQQQPEVTENPHQSEACDYADNDGSYY